MSNPTVEDYHSSAARLALVMLARCLAQNGALQPGQFSRQLKTTFNHPDASHRRADYDWMRALAVELDKDGL